ncbi:MAG TPA: hypothetical protein DCG14_10025 [Phycisphaerales bacterium]|nr:hypothetical protein [Phycisphaerales bacterium]
MPAPLETVLPLASTRYMSAVKDMVVTVPAVAAVPRHATSPAASVDAWRWTALKPAVLFMSVM